MDDLDETMDDLKDMIVAANQRSGRFNWKLTFKNMRCREPKWTTERLEKYAIRWLYNTDFIQTSPNNCSQAEEALKLMFIHHDTGVVNFWKLEDLAIRWVVKNRVANKYIGVDQEDAVTLLRILVESEIVDHPALYSGDLSDCPFISHAFENMSLVPHDDRRVDQTHPEIRRGRRITAVYIPRSYDGYIDISTQRFFELLAKLDDLDTLKVNNSPIFDFAEIILRFPNLKVLHAIERYIRIGIDVHNIFEGREIFSNLEKVFLGTCLDEDTLEALLFDSIVYFPKLSSLAFFDNSIRTFQKIAKRIEHEAKPIVNSNLRYLGLGGSRNTGHWVGWRGEEINAARNSQVSDSKEFIAIKTFLFAFQQLAYVDGNYGKKDSSHRHFVFPSYHPFLRGIMDINNARCVLDDIGTTSTIPSIPLALWPYFLASSGYDHKYWGRIWRNEVALFKQTGSSGYDYKYWRKCEQFGKFYGYLPPGPLFKQTGPDWMFSLLRNSEFQLLLLLLL